MPEVVSFFSMPSGTTTQKRPQVVLASIATRRRARHLFARHAKALITTTTCAEIACLEECHSPCDILDGCPEGFCNSPLGRCEVCLSTIIFDPEACFLTFPHDPEIAAACASQCFRDFAIGRLLLCLPNSDPARKGYCMLCKHHLLPRALLGVVATKQFIEK